MAGSVKRMLDDVTGTWAAMPKSQAMRWYAAALRHAPQILKQRKLYSADRDMHGELRFRLRGRDIAINVDDISSTPGNAYAFLRELMVRQIYFRAFQKLRIRNALDFGCNIGVVTIVLKELGEADTRVVGVDSQVFSDNTFRRKAERAPGITLEHHVLCGEETRQDPAALAAMCAPYGFDPELATTVEEVMERHSFSEIDFVKMDIEGGEFSVFGGRAAWLDRVQNIAMEVHRSVGDPTEIINILKARHFEVRWADDSGYACTTEKAGYIYASRDGSLRPA